ncbi:unnamed protein product [Miscanthus lutarioriparius]|uniref:Uncharacterized protein n=1 Tax=Miscanthus lutarioriparius TaxID=422564 RepID=A0A811SJF1_9POAL|nr:unnamed protein product [Miscanthus lutarioriparius]
MAKRRTNSDLRGIVLSLRTGQWERMRCLGSRTQRIEKLRLGKEMQVEEDRPARGRMAIAAAWRSEEAACGSARSPQASVLLKKICDDGGLHRRGVDATELSDKVSKLKKKFMKAAAKVAAGGRRLRKYRNQVLFETSMEAWPDLLPRDVAAAVQVQVARAARRRGNDARACL